MATKPSTALPPWATNVNYTIGPKTGQPTRGHVPGLMPNGMVPGKNYPMGAEEVNYYLGLNSEWGAWLADGSSSGPSSAHIVETDSLGKTVLQALDIIGSTPVAGPALSVTQGSSGSPVAYFARNSSDPGEAIVSIGGPTAAPRGIQVQSANFEGISIATSGAAPIHLGVQFATITTPGANTGAIWFPREGTVTSMRAAAGGRTWIQRSINQHVRIAAWDDSGIAVPASPTYASIHAGLSFPSTDEVISAMTVEVAITFEVNTAGAGAADLLVRLKNLGTTIFTRDAHVEGNVRDTRTIRHRVILGTAGAQSFDVDITRTTAGACSVTNIMTTIETMF